MQKVIPQKLTYFSAWFCPFAHRSTLALEHHGRKFINWEWEEALGWEHRAPTGKEEFEACERKDWIYHWKSPELLAANPLGMVPTFLEPVTGRSVTESIVCIEFIDEIARAAGSAAPPLLPDDPFDRAKARVMADKVNKQVTSNYYACLVRQDRAEQRDAFEMLLNGIEAFSAERKGAFFGGDEGMGLVDCVLLPYAWRLYVLEHYRSFSVPKSDPRFYGYHHWLEHATGLDYVQKTLPDADRYLKHVEKYANGTARSKVGNAVRRGKNAHDYADDE